MDTNKHSRLLDQVRDRCRLKHYSIRTEKTYIHWIKRFIFFHNKRHPKEMGKPELESFLTHLAVKDDVAAATQNLALSAILFLYRDALNITCRGWITSPEQRSPPPPNFPLFLHRLRCNVSLFTYRVITG